MPDRDDSERTPSPGTDPTRSSPEEHPGSSAETRTRTGAAKGADLGEQLPESVGGYRILSKLGEGGMGVVYEAEQQSPKRRVAVKIIRGGQFVSETRIKMFEREANTLARLKHANIGAIYEAGRTDDGQHFFAMELVRGATLDAYLRKRDGTFAPAELRFRLALFRKIADAVHYAHQRGVIHRDLKPSNIVVTEEDSELPEVKVLDFGLARITEGDVAATMTTEVGVIKGTLRYMSPEQARGNPDEIDVRADVYALGVILYEMISGKRPYDMSNKPLVEALRVICEEPPAPLGSTVSGARRLDQDIETIVGKALEKEAELRYASAAALSDDLGRWLTSQPILARPPSTTYQLRKFAARHRVLVGGVVAVIVTLAGGVAVSTALGLREARQRRSAERSSYVANIIAAESSMRDFELAEVKRRLAASPVHLRGWEWSHLDFRSEMSDRRLLGHSSRIYDVDVSPDGSYYASAAVDPDNRVRLWDVASGRQLQEFATGESTPEGGAGIRGVAFSPDGRLLAWGVDDSTVRISNLEDGRQLLLLEGHTDRVYAVAFTPDGRELVSVSEDGTVRRWNTATGDSLGVLEGHEAAVWGLAVCGDGSKIVTGDANGIVRVWDRASGRVLFVHETGAYVGDVACSPDGSRIAATGGEGFLRSWDGRTGDPLGSFAGHDDTVLSVAYSPHGDVMATTGKDRTVRLWDAKSGAELARLIGHDDVGTAVAFEPDGRRLVSVSWDRTLRVWNSDPSRVSPLLATIPGGVRSLAVTPDGSRVVYCSWDHFGVVDRATGERLHSVPVSGVGRRGMVVSPDGTLAAVSEMVDGSPAVLRIWNIDTDGAPEQLGELTDKGTGVAFIPGSSEVLVGYERHGTITRWDFVSGSTSEIDTPLPRANYLSVSPDGTRFAAAGGNFVRADLLLIELRTGEIIAQQRLRHRDQLAAVANNAGGLAYSPDGELLASVHLQDFTLRLWDGETLEPLATGVGHTEMVHGVAFTRDGSRIATAGWDASVRIWDGRTGEALLALRTDESSVMWGVDFTPDGKSLISGNRLGTIFAWRTREAR